MKARHHKPRVIADRWLDLHFGDPEVEALSDELTYSANDPAAHHPQPLLDQVRQAVAAYLTAEVPRG